VADAQLKYKIYLSTSFADVMFSLDVLRACGPFAIIWRGNLMTLVFAAGKPHFEFDSRGRSESIHAALS
jgi:hypothetical protein